MPQMLLPDNIPPAIKATSTTVTLAATHMNAPTRITIGGQQYKISSTLTLNTATTGLGGMDTGTLSNAHDLYYVYACANSSGTVGLVASLTAPGTGPSGFTTRYKLVGAFYSSWTSSQIGGMVSITGQADSDFIDTLLNISGSTSGLATYSGARWKRMGQMIFWEIPSFLQASGSSPTLVGNYQIHIPAFLQALSGGSYGTSNSGAQGGAFGSIHIGVGTSTTALVTGVIKSQSGQGGGAGEVVLTAFVGRNDGGPALWSDAFGPTLTGAVRFSANASFRVPTLTHTLLG